MPAALRRLVIGDDPQAWLDAGFAVHDDQLVLGRVVVDLVGTDGGRGIRGWMLDGVVTDLDGLSAIVNPEHRRPEPQLHRNHVFAIDHVVIETDDFARTVPAFEAAGLEERRSIEFDRNGSKVRQSFFWAGRTILEMIGPAAPKADGPGRASFWGLALVSSELDDTVAFLGDRISEPRGAVQPDRQISTLRTKDLGISVPIAIMSPHISTVGLDVE